MNTQAVTNQQPSASDAPADSKAIRIKHIGVSDLYRAAELLGGTATRSTSGHHYVVYRLPNNKQVHLPPIKTGTGKPIGRGGLQQILNQFLDAGVPHGVLEQTLHFVGATWWTPPTPNTELQEYLDSKPTITTPEQWERMNSMLTPTPTPAPAPEPEPEPKPRMRSLREAATLHLPNPKDEDILKHTLQVLRAKLENGVEPYQQLIINQDVDTQLNGDAFKFLFNEHASSVIAKDALEVYTKKENEIPLPPAPHGHQWSGLTLREVIQLDLSPEAATKYTQKLVYRFSRKLVSREQPFSRLMKEKHAIRRDAGNGKPTEYLFTDHAASVLAREAKNVYETIYKPQEDTSVTTEPASVDTHQTPGWCNLTLEEVIQLDLPKDTPAKFKRSIHQVLANSFRRKTPPMKDLIRDGHIIRRDDGYRVTEHAANILAQFARDNYDRKYPKPIATPTGLLMPTQDPNALRTRPLGEVIRTKLPAGHNKQHVTPLAIRISAAIAREEAPYADLLKNKDLTRTYNSQRKRHEYAMTPAGAAVLADTALELYQEHYAPETPEAVAPATPVAPTPAPQPTVEQPAAIPAAASATTPKANYPKQPALTPAAAITALSKRFHITPDFVNDTHVFLDLDAFTINLHNATQATNTSSFGEAATALIRQHNITPEIDDMRVMNIRKLLIDLEIATRN